MEFGKAIIFIDVRTPKEYYEGHIEGVINMPLDTLKSNLYTIENFKALNVLVHCKSGARSIQAVKILEGSGFENIYHFKEGYDKWKEVYGQ